MAKPATPSAGDATGAGTPAPRSFARLLGQALGARTPEA
jgi:hypothetical protein